MIIETDLKVVAKLAKERDEENWRFRTFLKVCDLSSKEVDAIVRRHYKDVASQIDCCACGNCCREMLPTLEESDVNRLAKGLCLETGEVITQYLARDTEGELTFNRRPCPFLVEKRCRVYAHRPSACRSFPHLHKKGFGSRLMQAVVNCSVCPIVFNVFERLKAELK